MKTVKVQVVYLEMLRPPPRDPPTPPEQVEIRRVHRPGVAFYRRLYDRVGRPWNWTDRKLIADEELAAVIDHDAVEIYVLYAAGDAAGYAELDRRRPGEIELAYFGIRPEFAGRGLGKYLLGWAIAKACSYQPRRLWLHTCELDHPAALPMYRKAGFEQYDQRTVEQVILD